MWTATLTNTTKNFNNIDYVVEFTDGTDTFSKTYKYSILDAHAESAKSKVKSHLYKLNNPTDLATGAIDTTTATPTAQELWNEDLLKLEYVQHLIDLGVLNGTETPVVALRNKVKADFKPAYIS